jgi:MFS family permease
MSPEGDRAPVTVVGPMFEQRPPDGSEGPVQPGLLARARGHLMDLTPLRVSQQFRTLFVGRSISDVGDEIVAVVVPYQVFEITHSTLAVGLLGLVQLVPVFVAPIVGGAVADATERRRLVTVTFAILAVTSALMAVNAFLPEPMLWPLYVFAFVSAAMYTFNRPALDTWPARLVEPELFASVSAVESGLGSAIRMTAPVLAGVLIAVIHPSGAFVVDVATFLVAIAFFRRMRPSPPSDEEAEVSWAAIVDGFRFLKGKRNLQSVFGADLIAMVFGFPMALLPAVALTLADGDQQRSAYLLGFLVAAPAVGSFLATLFSGRARHVRRQGRAIMVAIVVWGGAIVVFGLADTLWLSLAMLAIAGAGDMVSGIFRSAIMLAAVEDRYRGRLGGIGMAVWATGPSVGDVESGVVSTVFTVPIAIVSGGILTIVGMAVLRWFAPGFWRYDARDPVP